MESIKLRVALENVEKSEDTYSASLRIKHKGVERIIKLERLARKPVEAWATLDNERLVVELLGAGGEGFASCIIYLDNLDRRECRSLLVPRPS